MTYKFTGPQPGYKTKNKGIARMMREIRRQEAEERQRQFLAGNSKNPYGLENSNEQRREQQPESSDSVTGLAV